MKIMNKSTKVKESTKKQKAELTELELARQNAARIGKSKSAPGLNIPNGQSSDNGGPTRDGETAG